MATRQIDCRSSSSRSAGKSTRSHPYHDRHRRNHVDRPVEALALRGEQGGGRRAGAGIRPVFRHADRLLPRRLPDRSGPRRRRIARVSRLPDEMHGDGQATTASSDTKASKCATTSTATTWSRRSGSSVQAPRRAAVYNIGGSRHSNCSMLEAIEICEEISGKKLSCDVRRGQPHRRSHLVHFRCATVPSRLPEMGLSLRHPRHLRGDPRRVCCVIEGVRAESPLRERA